MKQGSLQEQIREDLTEHFPDGRPYSLIVFGDLHGDAGTATFMTQTLADAQALVALIKRQRVLLLQSPEPRQQYIRFVPTNTSADMPVHETRVSSHKEHALSWVVVARPV
jgi:hypothetical protein